MGGWDSWNEFMQACCPLIAYGEERHGKRGKDGVLTRALLSLAYQGDGWPKESIIIPESDALRVVSEARASLPPRQRGKSRITQKPRYSQRETLDRKRLKDLIQNINDFVWKRSGWKPNLCFLFCYHTYTESRPGQYHVFFIVNREAVEAAFETRRHYYKGAQIFQMRKGLALALRYSNGASKKDFEIAQYLMSVRSQASGPCGILDPKSELPKRIEIGIAHAQEKPLFEDALLSIRIEQRIVLLLRRAEDLRPEVIAEVLRQDRVRETLTVFATGEEDMRNRLVTLAAERGAG